MRIAALPGVRDGHTGIFPLDPSNRRSLHVYPIGDATPTPLPASGLTVRVATIYWQKAAPNDPRVAIDPQVAVSLSSADFFAGRDPVLGASVRAALASSG